ncbi:ImmA/IrrE family metallo-endopeptidase [Psychrobacillus sp.]|uniref:ImmA/IrrE family metallo-endopeptidase n=1 Tax=Psychrobacillus sp. TaxID=1871623 RepID=UPI0028BEDF21|nr:ImmA/IrrE family metallo-endopeptidase [Psychrobacillus sp.]
MGYDRLILEYPNVKVIEKVLPKGLPGLYYDNVIEIDKFKNKYEKHCILAEELGHYETTYGDITEFNDLRNLKLEKIARRWGYEKIVSLDQLIDCYVKGQTTLEEVCTNLEITPEYLKSVIDYYIEKYGLFKLHKEYKITFEPLNIKVLKSENN